MAPIDLSSHTTAGLLDWLTETANLLCTVAKQLEQTGKGVAEIPHGQRKQAERLVEECQEVWRAARIFQIDRQRCPTLRERLAEARNQKSED